MSEVKGGSFFKLVSLPSLEKLGKCDDCLDGSVENDSECGSTEDDVVENEVARVGSRLLVDTDESDLEDGLDSDLNSGDSDPTGDESEDSSLADLDPSSDSDLDHSGVIQDLIPDDDNSSSGPDSTDTESVNYNEQDGVGEHGASGSHSATVRLNLSQNTE